METLLLLSQLPSALVTSSDKEQLWVSMLVVRAHRPSQPGAVAAGKHPETPAMSVLTQPPPYTHIHTQFMVELVGAAETLVWVSGCDCGPT